MMQASIIGYRSVSLLILSQLGFTKQLLIGCRFLQQMSIRKSDALTMNVLEGMLMVGSVWARDSPHEGPKKRLRLVGEGCLATCMTQNLMSSVRY